MHNINGSRLLLYADKETLRELGVERKIDRCVILDGIEQLRNHRDPSKSDKVQFYKQFLGDDYAPLLHPQEKTYAPTRSCVISADQEGSHVYEKVRKWIGDLPDEIEIEKIEFVHNKDRYRAFLQQLLSAEQKQSRVDFQPSLDKETKSSERRKVLKRLEKLTENVKHKRSVQVARVWHGCESEDL